METCDLQLEDLTQYCIEPYIEYTGEGYYKLYTSVPAGMLAKAYNLTSRGSVSIIVNATLELTRGREVLAKVPVILSFEEPNVSWSDGTLIFENNLPFPVTVDVSVHYYSHDIVGYRKVYKQAISAIVSPGESIVVKHPRGVDWIYARAHIVYTPAAGGPVKEIITSYRVEDR